MALLHRLSLAAALMCAGVAAGQTCPAAQFRCPGSFSQSCGSDSGGEITRTVTCNSSGVITSCTISSADGRSCNCGTSGQCTLSPAPAPCDKRCGSQCLDGTDAVCCGTTVYEAGAVCCGGQGYEVGAVCCGSQGYVPGTVCCGELGYESGAVCCTDFACKGGFECCNDGIKACRLPGTSCCKGDPTRACPEGSDCVDTTCCPRLTPQSSAFTSYDPSTGFCCGDQTCAQNGTCQGGAGLCVCANGCAGSCCPSGTVCCPNKGWCASTQLGCPTCTGSNKMCDDGTCAPSGATCCGSGTYCPNGLTCQKCGGPPGDPDDVLRGRQCGGSDQSAPRHPRQRRGRLGPLRSGERPGADHCLERQGKCRRDGWRLCGVGLRVRWLGARARRGQAPRWRHRWWKRTHVGLQRRRAGVQLDRHRRAAQSAAVGAPDAPVMLTPFVQRF